MRRIDAKRKTRDAAQRECDRVNKANAAMRCKTCRGDGHIRETVEGAAIIGAGPCPACDGIGWVDS